MLTNALRHMRHLRRLGSYSHSEDGLLCLTKKAFLTVILEVPREEGQGASSVESLSARRPTPGLSWF